MKMIIGLALSAASAGLAAIMNLQSPAKAGGGINMYRSPFKTTSTETCSFKKKGGWAAGYHTFCTSI